jgi:hypothetical protein
MTDEKKPPQEVAGVEYATYMAALSGPIRPTDSPLWALFGPGKHVEHCPGCGCQHVELVNGMSRSLSFSPKLRAQAALHFIRQKLVQLVHR